MNAHALQLALDALVENDQHHQDHDDHDGYPSSARQETNRRAIAVLKGALAAAKAHGAIANESPFGAHADRIGHWNEGPETFVIIKAKDLQLGVQTYGPPVVQEQPQFVPVGFLLHWPAIGGGRTTIWHESRAAGDSIGCPVTPVFKESNGPEASLSPAPGVDKEGGLSC